MLGTNAILGRRGSHWVKVNESGKFGIRFELVA